MSEANFDITPDEARRIAELELEFLTPLRDVLIEEHTANYRWLMASLLAINAGGLLAIRDDVKSNLVSGFLFFLGVTFALLVARLGQRSTQKAIGPISNMSAALMATIVSGDYDQERIKEEQAAYVMALKSSWTTQASGWLSFMMFAMALFVMGINSGSCAPVAQIMTVKK